MTAIELAKKLKREYKNGNWSDDYGPGMCTDDAVYVEIDGAQHQITNVSVRSKTGSSYQHVIVLRTEHEVRNPRCKYHGLPLVKPGLAYCEECARNFRSHGHQTVDGFVL